MSLLKFFSNVTELSRGVRIVRTSDGPWTTADDSKYAKHEEYCVPPCQLGLPNGCPREEKYRLEE